MTQDQSDICRAEFEKWHTERYSSRIFLKTKWEAWQAGWNARPARPPLIIRDNFLRGFPNIPKNSKQLTKSPENVSCELVTNEDVTNADVQESPNPADTSQNEEYE